MIRGYFGEVVAWKVIPCIVGFLHVWRCKLMHLLAFVSEIEDGCLLVGSVAICI